VELQRLSLTAVDPSVRDSLMSKLRQVTKIVPSITSKGLSPPLRAMGRMGSILPGAWAVQGGSSKTPPPPPTAER